MDLELKALFSDKWRHMPEKDDELRCRPCEAYSCRGQCLSWQCFAFVKKTKSCDVWKVGSFLNFTKTTSTQNMSGGLGVALLEGVKIDDDHRTREGDGSRGGGYSGGNLFIILDQPAVSRSFDKQVYVKPCWNPNLGK